MEQHPSIIMWQPGNHPSFSNFSPHALSWMEELYAKIYPNDPSRLISFTANNSRFGPEGAPNDKGT